MRIRWRSRGTCCSLHANQCRPERPRSCGPKQICHPERSRGTLCLPGGRPTKSQSNKNLSSRAEPSDSLCESDVGVEGPAVLYTPISVGPSVLARAAQTNLSSRAQPRDPVSPGRPPHKTRIQQKLVIPSGAIGFAKRIRWRSRGTCCSLHANQCRRERPRSCSPNKSVIPSAVEGGNRESTSARNTLLKPEEAVPFPRLKRSP